MPRYTTGGEGSQRRVIARLYLLGGVFALCFGLLSSRAIFFHVKDNARLEKVAMRQYRTAVSESTRRGKVLDAQGRELAVNVEVPSVWADPRAIVEPEEVSQQLSEVLGIDKDKVFKRITSVRKFVWLKRWISEAEMERLQELDIEGVSFMQENKRSYPNGSLAAAVLGAVGLDSEALGGIELALDEFLVQRVTPSSYKRDARGHLYLSLTDTVAMRPPNAVELTIDKTVQYIAEQELRKALDATKSKVGTIVVVDPRNGDILAMANLPTFDPNNYADYDLDLWKNRAIADSYEPGSTFKVIVVSSALEAGTVTPIQTFFCEKGQVEIGDHVLNDSHAHDELSVHDIIKVSSNIGAYKIEKTLGPARTYEAIRQFGFGDKTGIELVGESSGIIQPPHEWSRTQFATIAFGQGISATPLQMVMAFAAIANGGHVLTPHVIKRMRDASGNIVMKSDREVRRRPISRETAHAMTQMLQAVVDKGGTGVLAASLEYPVAGKTGTAQKPGPHGGYLKGKYLASFIGFAPADDPRVVVYVGLDEPKGYYYGGQVAAPVFREVVEKTLHYLNVPSRRRLVVSNADENGGEAYDRALPAVPQKLPCVASLGDGTWQLPDFTGLTMRGVVSAAGNAAIDFRFIGSGVAVSQSPAPGSTIRGGQECAVEFRSTL